MLVVFEEDLLRSFRRRGLAEEVERWGVSLEAVFCQRVFLCLLLSVSCLSIVRQKALTTNSHHRALVLSVMAQCSWPNSPDVSLIPLGCYSRCFVLGTRAHRCCPLHKGPLRSVFYVLVLSVSQQEDALRFQLRLHPQVGLS